MVVWMQNRVLRVRVRLGGGVEGAGAGVCVGGRIGGVSVKWSVEFRISRGCGGLGWHVSGVGLDGSVGVGCQGHCGSWVKWWIMVQIWGGC